MTSRIHRAGLALAAAAGCGVPLLAQDDAHWCRIVNHSNRDYTVAIQDKVAVGKVYFRDGTPNATPVKLTKAPDNFILRAGAAYDFQTDTTGATLAITLRFAANNPKVWTDLNFKKAPGSGTWIATSSDDFATSPVTVTFANYLAAGKPFITLE